MTALLLRLTLCLAALLWLGPAAAADTLVLGDGVAPIDAWPAVRVFADPTHEMSLADMESRRDRFVVPNVPANNFGARKETLWLRVPLAVHSTAQRWVLEVDYPPLNRVDVYLVENGFLAYQAALGNTLTPDERPMRTRSHAVALELRDQARYELYLRVNTTSSFLVPIVFHKADAFVAHESGHLLLQGLMFGVTLILMVSSLGNAVTQRDRVFAYYAMMLIGVTLFFVSYSGVGHEFIWSAQVGVLEKVSPWGALLALSGASLFVAEALELARFNPGQMRVFFGVVAAGIGSILLSMLNVLSYRHTTLAATIIGPIPIVMALQASLRQARAGSAIACYMALGWAAYTVGSLSMAALLRGALPGNFWTQHLFQFGSMIEMFAWTRVLALRSAAVRREAERALAEKHALHVLAHTDALTGLPNRRGLAHALQAALPATRSESELVLYLLDLDGFKAVNDRLGHDAGDELLVQVSHRLRGVLRASDIVSRQGGDEFVVMSPGVTGEEAALAIGQKMLDAFKAPFEVGGQFCRVGLTIGFALAPHDGSEAGDLLRRADAAMYAGKQSGRNCIRRGAASPGLAAA